MAFASMFHAENDINYTMTINNIEYKKLTVNKWYDDNQWFLWHIMAYVLVINIIKKDVLTFISDTLNDR